MNNDKVYDCIIVGGGLAGLSLSILLAKKNKQVLVIEKKTYPFHKVCGEYISMESWDFLKRLGLPLEEMNLPKIKNLLLTSVSGLEVKQELDLGGFGISRYTLDNALATLAKESGVSILENATVTKCEIKEHVFYVTSTAGICMAHIVCASFGKHAFSNFYKAKSESENWVGIKYHIQYNLPDDLIALHNFNGGYCGISKIEENKCCIWYLVKASPLKRYSNNIAVLEQEELKRNPYLNDIFKNALFLFEKPVTVSNVTFSVKKPVDNHIFYLGDSAGTIAPLSGNGMSNAMRASHMLSECLIDYFEGKYTFSELENIYTIQWSKAFKKRIMIGRWIQYFFCKNYLTTIFIKVMKSCKLLRLLTIRQTQGEQF